jgi:hypothetical protein
MNTGLNTGLKTGLKTGWGKGKEKVTKRGWKEDVGMGWKSVSVHL